jgi:hypothetical protein
MNWGLIGYIIGGFVSWWLIYHYAIAPIWPGANW